MRLAKNYKWKLIQERINKFHAQRPYSFGFYSHGDKITKRIIINSDFTRVARLTLRKAMLDLQFE